MFHREGQPRGFVAIRARGDHCGVITIFHGHQHAPGHYVWRDLSVFRPGAAKSRNRFFLVVREALPRTRNLAGKGFRSASTRRAGKMSGCRWTLSRITSPSSEKGDREKASEILARVSKLNDRGLEAGGLVREGTQAVGGPVAKE